MLQTGGVLATWSLAEEPQPGETCRAEALAGHRLAYLDYEGPISGGRGQVTRWDAGLYTTVDDGLMRLVLAMSGARLQGRITLTRSAETPTAWQFRWEESGNV
jgi:hypothetical protein